jgi:hypothetical protein
MISLDQNKVRRKNRCGINAVFSRSTRRLKKTKAKHFSDYPENVTKWNAAVFGPDGTDRQKLLDFVL